VFEDVINRELMTLFNGILRRVPDDQDGPRLVSCRTRFVLEPSIACVVRNADGTVTEYHHVVRQRRRRRTNYFNAPRNIMARAEQVYSEVYESWRMRRQVTRCQAAIDQAIAQRAPAGVISGLQYLLRQASTRNTAHVEGYVEPRPNWLRTTEEVMEMRDALAAIPPLTSRAPRHETATEVAARSRELARDIARRTDQALYDLIARGTTVATNATNAQPTTITLEMLREAVVALSAAPIPEPSPAEALRYLQLARDLGIIRGPGDAEAERRGWELLLSELDPAQRLSLEQHGYFDVIGGTTGIRYRITKGRQQNVYRLDARGRVTTGLCFVPTGGLCEGDVMLAQKTSLELVEKDALKVAVPFPAGFAAIRMFEEATDFTPEQVARMSEQAGGVEGAVLGSAGGHVGFISGQGYQVGDRVTLTTGNPEHAARMAGVDMGSGDYTVISVINPLPEGSYHVATFGRDDNT
jgi:hypothetical protein